AVPAGVPAQREAAVLPRAQPLAARAEVLLGAHAARARARVRLLRGAPARVARRPGARVRLAPRRRLAVAQAARAGGRAPRGPGLAPRPDGAVLRGGPLPVTPHVREAGLGRIGVRLANGLLSLYWRGAARWIA